MRGIDGLFGESPFEALMLHGRKVHESIRLLQDLFAAVARGDAAVARELADRIGDLETEADRIQTRLQEQLAGRIFVPVDKRQLHQVLDDQDNMADRAEEIGVIATCRPLHLSAALWPEFDHYLGQVIECCGLVAGVLDRMDLLVESSFSGRDALTVSKLVTEVNQREDAVKEIETDLMRKLLGIETGIAEIELTIWWHVVAELGALARSADRTAGGIRSLLKAY